jgi:hypothetical protein
MKYFLITIFVCHSLKVNAHDTLNVYTQKTKLKHLISINYGWPYFDMPTKHSQGRVSNLYNTNHIGIRYEFYETKIFSYGVEYTYAKQAVKDNNFGVSSSITKHRLLARASIHKYIADPFEVYAVFGLGLKYSKITDANYLFEENNKAIVKLLPISYRMGGGFKLFVTKHIGFHAEIGIGGPLLQGGLSVRF